jgi:YVTN family beta-propeller protein
MVYMTNDDDGAVAIIDTATNKVVDRIPVNGYSYGVAFTPDGEQAYVTVSNAESVIIDTKNRSITGKINAPAGLYLIAITPDGTKAYMSNGQDTIHVLCLANNTIIDSIFIGSSPLGIAINRNSTRVYITTVRSCSLLVIDTVTNKVIYNIAMCRFEIGSGPAVVPLS